MRHLRLVTASDLMNDDLGVEPGEIITADDLAEGPAMVTLSEADLLGTPSEDW